MMIKLSASVSVIGMIFFGTICSLLAKLIYSVKGENLYGEVARYEKPWFQVLTMFFGMSVCILLDLPRYNSRPKAGDEESTVPLQSQSESQHDSTSVWIISIPTLFDLFATACGCTGLLYTTVSVYQMLRGAMLVWTALLSVLFLGRQLTRMNYLGISLCVCGITLVGLANVLAEGNPRSRADTSLGIIIILIGQVLQAGQVVIEEFLLQGLNMSSVRIVAWEGVFGMIHCLVWVFPLIYFLPGRDHGHLENPVDAFYMFFHSWAIFGIIITDMILMLLYNLCGMEVTENLNAVHRVVIETLRTLCVWLVDLLLYYVISEGRIGEKWTVYSFVQLFGFVLLVLGTLAYNYEHLLADYQKRSKIATDQVPVVAERERKDAVMTTIPVPELKYDAITSTQVMQRTPAESLPIGIDVSEEDEDEDELDGSFYGSAVGSASHGSYLPAGTPSSGGGMTMASLRQRLQRTEETTPLLPN